MSGTSLDAVDCALVDFSAGSDDRPGNRPASRHFVTIALPAALRDELMALQSSGPDELARAALSANALSDLYAQAVARVLAEAELKPAQVRAIGAHGQTVRHRPELGYTLQLLNGARLAERSGIDVVCDFRSADIAAGGQGAPLVPTFHAEALGNPMDRRVIVNIGGTANVSLLAPGAIVLGFDTGPGNALLDAWAQHHLGAAFDDAGRWAASADPDPDLLAAFLSEAYFARPAPKSTGRDLFDFAWLEGHLAALAGPLPAATVQSTLAELTATSIAQACAGFAPADVFVCGGGARNLDLLQRLATKMAPAHVDTTLALGVDPQAVEALAFAWLAKRRIELLAGNLPGVTGAKGSRVLGALYPAPR